MERLKIVWIEDDSHIIYSVVRPLEKAGYEIVTIRDLEEAERRINEVLGAAIVILDLICPSCTGERYPGLKFMRILRRDHDIKAPVIVLSVVSNQQVLDELKELGAMSVLRKPILPSHLADAVASCKGRQLPGDEIAYS